VSQSPWLDPRGFRFAVLLAVAAACANGIWILLDNSVPSWDQSYYLSVTLTYRDALEGGGATELLRSIHSTDPSHAPLFTVLMLPFVYVFGPGPRSGLLLNFLLAPALYLAAGQIAWLVFRNWIARLLAIGLVATMPLLVGLNHNVLQDFLLVTLTTVSLFLLLRTEGFSRGWISVAMGLAMGLGSLTKVTFPLFIVGPLLVIFVQVAFLRARAQREEQQPLLPARTLARNLAGAALAYAIVTVPWYGPNLSPTLDYVSSTTSGPLALGAGPTDPYTFTAIASFTLGVINGNVSWIILIAGAIALVLCVTRLRSLLSRPLQPNPLFGLGFLCAWALVPYLSVGFAHNQDVRLMAPAMPAVAILVAGAMSAVPRPRARMALTAIVGTLLAYQTLNHTTPVTPSFLPDRIIAGTDSYWAVAILNSDPIGYEQLPGEDYGTPVIEYIKDVAKVDTEPERNRSVCMLQSEPVVNSPTFRYLAQAHEQPFVFVDLIVEPGRSAGLREQLAGCEFALYVKQPAPDPTTAAGRLKLVNATFAASFMTPRLVALFDGPRRSFQVAEPAGDTGRAKYLSHAGRGVRLWVLSRRQALAPGNPPD